MTKEEILDYITDIEPNKHSEKHKQTTWHCRECVIEAMEEYHQARLKERIPTEEEIANKSQEPLTVSSPHTTLHDIKSRAFWDGAKWLRDKLLSK